MHINNQKSEELQCTTVSGCLYCGVDAIDSGRACSTGPSASISNRLTDCRSHRTIFPIYGSWNFKFTPHVHHGSPWSFLSRNMLEAGANSDLRSSPRIWTRQSTPWLRRVQDWRQEPVDSWRTLPNYCISYLKTINIIFYIRYIIYCSCCCYIYICIYVCQLSSIWFYLYNHSITIYLNNIRCCCPEQSLSPPTSFLQTMRVDRPAQFFEGFLCDFHGFATAVPPKTAVLCS